MQLQSVAGQGSNFTLTLRFGRSQEALQERRLAPRTAITGLRGLRVLLAEDNLINVMVAKTLLEGKGVVVTVAENGQVALDILLAQPQGFDAVLMDIQMPVLDGREATRRIREDARLAALPILAMTADAMPEDRQKCLDCGMNDYLTKPVDSEVLYAMLARWCPVVADAM